METGGSLGRSPSSARGRRDDEALDEGHDPAFRVAPEAGKPRAAAQGGEDRVDEDMVDGGDPFPVVGQQETQDVGDAQRQTATRYLAALAEAGVLDTVRQGKIKLFVNKRLLALLLTDTEVWQPFM